VIITQALAADLDEIVALEHGGFEHAVWSAESWLDEIEADDRHVLVSRDFTGAITGVATFQTVAEVADLHRVVVRSDVRGQGIARRLIQAGTEWAEGLGAERLMLEVEYGNDIARRLYEFLGFLPLAKRSDYYGPGLDALVMHRHLGADRGWADDERWSA